MNLSNVRWGAAIGGMLLVEVLMIALAFGWVAVYSHLIEPGLPVSVYQDYAMKASPWVAFVTGVPLFYLICRWIGAGKAEKALPTAMATFVFYLLLDVPFALLAPGPQLLIGFLAINWAAKGAACYLGGKHAARGAAKVA